MSKVDLFNNLILLAAADKKFTEEEVGYLAEKSHQWGITDEEFESALIGAGSQEAELVIPAAEPERSELLKEMIHLMAIDGELAEVEKEMCARASAAMDFTTAQFQQVLSDLIGDMK